MIGMYVHPMNGYPSFGSSYDSVPMNVPSYYQLFIYPCLPWERGGSIDWDD